MFEKHTSKNSLRALLLSPILAFSVIAIPAANAAPFDEITITGTKSKSFSSYDAIYVAPVEVSLPEPKYNHISRNNRSARPVSGNDQDLKANDLYEDISYALGRKFELADGPGAGILTIKATLTDLQSTRPTIADLSNQINLSRDSIYTGGASASFTLSENGTQIATLFDKYTTTLNDGRPRIGIWEDTDRAFKRWGKNLTKYISKN